MAIFSITKPFNSRVFKLRLPRRSRSKPSTASSPPETTSPLSGADGVLTLGITGSTKEDEFREVFRFLDANNDGKISVEELGAYFGSVGESVSHDEAEKMIKEFSKGGISGGHDEDSDLLLEFGEFVKVMELRDGGDHDGDKVLRQAFEVYEVEKGSGCITAEGLRVVLRRLGDVKSVEECEAMIRVYDLDGNGVLDFHEFYKMMTT